MPHFEGGHQWVCKEFDLTEQQGSRQCDLWLTKGLLLLLSRFSRVRFCVTP